MPISIPLIITLNYIKKTQYIKPLKRSKFLSNFLFMRLGFYISSISTFGLYKLLNNKNQLFNSELYYILT